jgi:hypothetical protein
VGASLRLDAKHGVATFQAATFLGLFYLTRLRIGLLIPGFAFFGRPYLRQATIGLLKDHADATA